MGAEGRTRYIRLGRVAVWQDVRARRGQRAGGVALHENESLTRSSHFRIGLERPPDHLLFSAPDCKPMARKSRSPWIQCVEPSNSI